jgi:alkylated DNA nucleotide flippase Atl1
VQNNIVGGKGGNFYTVDLPDEHIAKMLDWDAPLSEQPEAVRNVIDQVRNIPETEWRRMVDSHGEYDPTGLGVTAVAAIRRGDVKTGADLVEYAGNNPAGSAWLRDRGIPGIRYFDGGSRGAGQGTRNFVIFDGDTAKILKRE